MIAVKIGQAISMLTKYLRAGLVPMIVSSPGIGKSQAVYQVAEHYNLKVIDFRLAQCDPTDLNGFPKINEKTDRAGYTAMDTFPLEGDKIPEGYSGWLLFFDELTSAPKAVQAASYKVILDRAIGQRKLHKNVAMVAAGNLATDRAIVEEMSTALMSRLVHIHLTVDPIEFTSWATANGIDHRITSFINFKNSNVYTFNPDNSDETYACPRTWEFANRILKTTDLNDPDLLPLLAGTLSEGVAREFIGFCKIHESLIKVPEIVANPAGCRVPDDRSILFAMTGSMAHQATKDNLSKLGQYLVRMPKEFQVVCLRDIIKRSPKLEKEPFIQEWQAINASVLF